VGFELTTLVVIGTDCTGGCKSNYHTITTTMAPQHICLTKIKYMLYNVQDYSVLYNSAVLPVTGEGSCGTVALMVLWQFF
jgi:hypothetical protein